MRRTGVSSGVAMGVALALTAVCGDAASGAFRGSSGAMVYASDRDGNPELYLGRLAVTAHTQFGDVHFANASPCRNDHPDEEVRLVETRLTADRGADLAPAISPRRALDDRTAWDVAWDSNRDGDREILTLTLADAPAAGDDVIPVPVPGEPQRLTANSTDDYSPAWSPGPSRRIAFVSDRTGNPEIFVMNADGSGQARLTSHPAADDAPAWSPDGTEIVFTSDRGGERELWAVAADGRSPARQLTNGAAPKQHPNWYRFANLLPDAPPDEELILFDSPRIEFEAAIGDLVDNELYYVDEFGADQRRIGGAPSDETHPVWAPSGTCVAFDSDRSGRRQIHVMASDGRPLRQLTAIGANRDPDWQSLPEGAETFPNPEKAPNATGVTCTETGNEGSDLLIGTPRDDVLCGKGGRDRIIGRGGRDILSGGTGRDYLSGGPGRDRIYGRDAARDKIAGGRGRDLAVVDRRRDRVRSVEVRR